LPWRREGILGRLARLPGAALRLTGKGAGLPAPLAVECRQGLQIQPVAPLGPEVRQTRYDRAQVLDVLAAQLLIEHDPHDHLIDDALLFGGDRLSRRRAEARQFIGAAGGHRAPRHHHLVPQHHGPQDIRLARHQRRQPLAHHRFDAVLQGVQRIHHLIPAVRARRRGCQRQRHAHSGQRGQERRGKGPEAQRGKALPAQRPCGRMRKRRSGHRGQAVHDDILNSEPCEAGSPAAPGPGCSGPAPAPFPST
jgi:hypothetical protein